MPQTTGQNVVFYVQHLLGMGHIRRTAALAEAVAKAGRALDVTVTVLNGGAVDMAALAPCCRVVQLPAIGTGDGGFSDLRRADGTPVDDAFRQQRAETLLAAVTALRPAALVLELYPFGRRQFRFELEPLLTALAAWDDRPQVISSVRDVLVPPAKPERLDWITDQLSQHIDHILVHGDPGFMRLDESFPVDASYAGRLHYTGFVLDPGLLHRLRETGSDPVGSDPAEPVLVSAGGGAVGHGLLSLALAARARLSADSALAQRPWRLVAGPSMPAADYADLARQVAGLDGVELLRELADLPLHHARAALSIGQAGYNTVMEWLAAGRRGLAVPYAEARETEQQLRAGRLAARGLLALADPRGLDASGLAAAIDALWHEGTGIADRGRIPSLAGAGRSADFILERIAP